MKTHSQEYAASLTPISTSQFSIVSQYLLQRKNLKIFAYNQAVLRITEIDYFSEKGWHDFQDVGMAHKDAPFLQTTHIVVETRFPG